MCLERQTISRILQAANAKMGLNMQGFYQGKCLYQERGRELEETESGPGVKEKAGRLGAGNWGVVTVEMVFKI